MSKTIAVRGKEKCDFTYYMAKTLASNGFTVCVIDNSLSKDLFRSVNRTGDKGAVEKENIAYIEDAVVSGDFKEKFDYVIFYQGMNVKELNTEYSFIMPDYTDTVISALLMLPSDLFGDSFFILRDRVSRKVTEKSIIRRLGIKEEQLLGFLPLTMEDESAYQIITYEGRTKLKGLSYDMQLAVLSAVALVTGDKIKEVRKYYRKAKRTKRF